MRTGEQYLSTLGDGREIYVEGSRVDDVRTHAGFSGIAHTVAELYDIAADPGSRMSYEAPETGREANTVFMIPRSREDLAARREAITRWADHSGGFVGRSPDHVGTFLAGFAAHADLFDRPERRYGDHVRAYYRRLLDESLFCAYAIIPPQISRGQTASGWEDDLLQVGVAEQREDGFVLRGSQMLATAAAVADEVLVSCIKPLTEDDAAFAISVVLPVATPGLKLYCRRTYGDAQPSAFDYPLSTRFDETDALLVFDEVFVPWERVFVNQDVGALRSQFFATGAHVLGNAQAQIRLVSKLKFLLGIARRIAQVNQIDKFPGVQDNLGELAALAALVESGVLAAEYAGQPDDGGLFRPAPRHVYGAMGLQSELYPRVLHIVRELVGGGVLQLPSSHHELRNPATRADMDRYVQSPGVSSVERIKLFKLAWDAIGSEFAGRHHQYEMFYAGAPFVTRGYAFRNYGYDEPLELVDRFLDGYDLEELSGAAGGNRHAEA